jgi:hypothetical protein
MKVTIGDYLRGAKRDRKVKVEISGDDTYSLDHTLALIIAPALKKYKEIAGDKVIWGCFLPENDWELKGAAATRANKAAMKKQNEVLDKMIRAFQYIIDGCADVEHDEEIKEGLSLFAEYYRGLWW